MSSDEESEEWEYALDAAMEYYELVAKLHDVYRQIVIDSVEESEFHIERVEQHDKMLNHVLTRLTSLVRTLVPEGRVQKSIS